MAKFMKKVLKCIWESKVVDICILGPATFTQVIANALKVLDLGLLRPYTLPQVTMEVVDVCQVYPATITLLITEDMLI